MDPVLNLIPPPTFVGGNTIVPQHAWTGQGTRTSVPLRGMIAGNPRPLGGGALGTQSAYWSALPPQQPGNPTHQFPLTGQTVLPPPATYANTYERMAAPQVRPPDPPVQLIALNLAAGGPVVANANANAHHVAGVFATHPGMAGRPVHHRHARHLAMMQHGWKLGTGPALPGTELWKKHQVRDDVTAQGVDAINKIKNAFRGY